MYSERCYSILLGVGRHKFDSSVDDDKVKPNNNTKKKSYSENSVQRMCWQFYKYSFLTNNVFCKCSIVSYRFFPLSLLFFLHPRPKLFPPFFPRRLQFSNFNNVYTRLAKGKKGFWPKLRRSVKKK